MSLNNMLIETTDNTNKSFQVYKSNELIESSYNLDTSENRLVYLAMTKLATTILEKNLNIEETQNRIKLAQFDLLFISVVEYRKTFNIKANNIYETLAETATKLYGEEVLYIKENGDFGRKRWVTTCEYNHEGKGISLEFNSRMIKDLLVFDNGYTSLLFEDFVPKLRGKLSFRIYELCKKYIKIGFRDFEIEDLMFKLATNDKDYPTYALFKRAILSNIKEIVQKTNLLIEYKEIGRIRKTGKVCKIRFIIHAQDQQLTLFDNNETYENESTRNQVKIISELIHHNISSQQARDILITALTAIDKLPELKDSNTKVKDYISEKVKVCDEYIKIKGTGDYIGLLLSALKKNFKKKIVIPPSQKEVVVDSDKSNQTKFNNFKGREYDWDKLENGLLGYEEVSIEDVTK